MLQASQDRLQGTQQMTDPAEKQPGCLPSKPPAVHIIDEDDDHAELMNYILTLIDSVRI